MFTEPRSGVLWAASLQIAHGDGCWHWGPNAAGAGLSLLAVVHCSRKEDYKQIVWLLSLI